MKVNAFDHPKTKGLKAFLRCSRAQVIGHLELLWYFTAKHAPQGDIGKWSDDVIAEACDYTGVDLRDSGFFVRALVANGFLNTHPTRRYLVHDWPDHAPRWVLAQLKRANLAFIEPTAVPTTWATAEASTVASLFPAQPHPAKSEEKIAKAAPSRARDEVWEAVLLSCGIPLDDKITKSQRGSLNKAVSEIKAALGENPDIEEIFRRADAHRRVWTKIRCTPASLARHWSEVQASSTSVRRRAAVQTEKLPELKGPRFIPPARRAGEPTLAWLKRVGEELDQKQLKEAA